MVVEHLSGTKVRLVEGKLRKLKGNHTGGSGTGRGFIKKTLESVNGGKNVIF